MPNKGIISPNEICLQFIYSGKLFNNCIALLQFVLLSSTCLNSIEVPEMYDRVKCFMKRYKKLCQKKRLYLFEMT